MKVLPEKFKLIDNKFKWYPNDKWAWPASDDQLIRVIDMVSDVDRIVSHIPKNRRFNCIQAGGACGVWPIRFCDYFQHVQTFEPDVTNFECILENNSDDNRNRIKKNLRVNNCALGIEPDLMYLKSHPSEIGNAGAYYLSNDNTGYGAQVLKLDNLGFLDVDLIQLDVEGMEFEALKGAENTILKYKPYVVIEEKHLPQQPSNCDLHRARNYLIELGYVQIDTFHRDVMFCYKGL